MGREALGGMGPPKLVSGLNGRCRAFLAMSGVFIPSLRAVYKPLSQSIPC